MTTIPTQIRIDSKLKEDAVHKLPPYNKKTLLAMAEANKISGDPDVKGYDSLEELKAALDNE